MAKKQTRRSISVSRATYERLKAFCETQGISMSQFVENRVGDFLATDEPVVLTPRPPAPPRPAVTTPRPAPTSTPLGVSSSTPRPMASTMPSMRPDLPRSSAVTPMTSAAARFAVEPPPPIIRPRPEPVDVKPPSAPTADQIFTF